MLLSESIVASLSSLLSQHDCETIHASADRSTTTAGEIIINCRCYFILLGVAASSPTWSWVLFHANHTCVHAVNIRLSPQSRHESHAPDTAPLSLGKNFTIFLRSNVAQELKMKYQSKVDAPSWSDGHATMAHEATLSLSTNNGLKSLT